MSRTRQLAAWARSTRSKVIERLAEQHGPRCSRCGNPFDIEINHLRRRHYAPRKISRWMRASYLRRELRRGELNLLCSHCNKTSGRPAEWSRFRPRGWAFGKRRAA